MDDAQDVLVDWTQRALLYSQTDEWDLARAEMTAIEEMQRLRKFAVSSGSAPRTPRAILADLLDFIRGGVSRGSDTLRAGGVSTRLTVRTFV